MKTIEYKDKHDDLIRFEVDVNNPSAELGFGGTGRVYKGIRINIRTGAQREVAIKFLNDNQDPSVYARAKRETEVRIHSDNLVEMLDFVTEIDERGKEHYYVVSELLNGVMLFDLLKGEIATPDGEIHDSIANIYDMLQSNRDKFAVYLVRHILSGIVALHDAGYIHRDIDPSNVMITTDGKVKLIDFGLAKKLNLLNTQDQQLTSQGIFYGKASYAAPELVHGDIDHQDFTTDIYAIGILLFQLVTGELPFTGPINEVLHMQVHNKLPLDKIKNKKIRRVIEKATQKRQIKRFRSAYELRVALDGIVPKPAPTPTPDTWRTWIYIIAGVMALAVGVLLGLFF